MRNQKKRCLQWCLGAALAQFVLGGALAGDLSQVTNCADIVQVKLKDGSVLANWKQYSSSDPMDGIDILCPVGSFIVDSFRSKKLADEVCPIVGGSPNSSIPYSDLGGVNADEHRPVIHCSSVPGMNGKPQDLSIKIQCDNGNTKAFTADEDAQSIKCNK